MMPYVFFEVFSLLVLDMEKRIIYVIDPTQQFKSVQLYKPSLFYRDRIHSISVIFDRAMRKIEPAWNDDIYNWRVILPDCAPITEQRYFFNIC